MTGKRKIHPLALRAQVDDLFSEIIEVDEQPEDYYTTQKFKGKEYRGFNESKYLRFHVVQDGKHFLRVKIDRRDNEQLKRVIEQQLRRYLNGHNDRTKELFKTSKLKKIDELQTALCPNYDKDNHTDQLKLSTDLEAYKSALIKEVDEIATKNAEPVQISVNSFPFSNQRPYEVFYYLLNNLNKRTQVRYSQIFHFIKQRGIDPYVGAKDYIEFISTQVDSRMVGKEIRYDAQTRIVNDRLEGIYEEFLVQEDQV